MKLSVRSVTKVFEHSHREATPALENLSFDVRAGEFLCLLGPSGCGKTTLLHIIAGLESADSGCVLMDGREIQGPGPDRVVESRMELQEIVSMLQTMPELDRSAFVLCVFHELPYAEVARVLGLSLANTKVKIHRVRKRLLAARVDKEVC